MELYNTRYSPNFHSNLISHGLMKASLLVNFRSNCIETTEGRQGFRYPKLSPENLILATKRSAQEPRSEGSIQTWHRRLGHVGTERIEKLAEMTEGITIESNPGKKKQAKHMVCSEGSTST
ncbi:Polynucleotidyl transferase, ribonuclease H fold [Penicillium digitatum]|uniref:Polynucleotidyl transferase, ribonuclease H fold n=1 Tax=Penicillium digitatum TaxID=36651 RepID=A0A7T7BN88_PENDI|nr:Polynucleotidyl transferase, ribonuclease H fold [Penicillium digitatum]